MTARSHEYTQEETAMLIEGGFVASWVSEIQEHDEVAIALTDGWGDTARREVRVLRVTSLRSDVLYHDGKPFSMVRFIGFDMDGLPHHESYAASLPCFINHPISPLQER